MSLSVIPAPRNTAAYLAAVIYLCCAALAGGIWYFTTDYLRMRNEVNEFERDRSRITLQIAQGQQALSNAPDLDSLAKLRQRVDWYNSQISQGAQPLIDHLDVLEAALPDTVHLSSLFYDRQGRFITLSLLSEDEDALRAAYGALSSAYQTSIGARVDLERQITLDSTGTRQFQFDARVSE